MKTEMSLDKPAIGRISERTQEGEGRAWEEMAPKRAAQALGEAQPTQGPACSEALNLRTGCRLHSGRSGGTLSATPELILETPV